MRRGPLFVLLIALWLLAPLAVAAGISPGAPSFVVMPVVAAVAAWQAPSLRDAGLLPGLSMLLPGTYALVTGWATQGISLMLLDRVLWIHAIHVLPVVVVSVGLRWALQSAQLRSLARWARG